jgi:hypothetical protein
MYFGMRLLLPTGNRTIKIVSTTKFHYTNHLPANVRLRGTDNEHIIIEVLRIVQPGRYPMQIQFYGMRAEGGQ